MNSESDQKPRTSSFYECKRCQYVTIFKENLSSHKKSQYHKDTLLFKKSNGKNLRKKGGYGGKSPTPSSNHN